MSVGESDARIKMFVKQELANVDLPDQTIDAITKAVAKAVSENNREIEKELRNLRNLIR